MLPSSVSSPKWLTSYSYKVENLISREEEGPNKSGGPGPRWKKVLQKKISEGTLIREPRVIHFTFIKLNIGKDEQLCFFLKNLVILLSQLNAAMSVGLGSLVVTVTLSLMIQPSPSAKWQHEAERLNPICRKYIDLSFSLMFFLVVLTAIKIHRNFTIF